MATILFAGDEQQRSPQIVRFLNRLVKQESMEIVIQDHHSIYADPKENLADLLECLSGDKWSEPCIIALDVKYPTHDYGGIEVVHDGIVRMFGRIPARYVVWYSVFLAQQGIEQERIRRMARDRKVTNLVASGVGNDLLSVAKFLLPLLNTCGGRRP